MKLVSFATEKLVIYGSIATRVAGVPAVVNAMAGLGFLFSSETFIARLLRPVIRVLFRLLLNNDRTTVILQNRDDAKVLCDSGTLVPIKDVDALVIAIRKLLHSPETRMRMGQAGRQLVKDKFSLEKVIGETLDVYRFMLQ